MDERSKIAERLRVIAEEIENEFSEEEEVRREFMDQLKTKFIQMIKKDPRYKHESPEKLWETFKEDITVDIRKLRG